MPPLRKTQRNNHFTVSNQKRNIKGTLFLLLQIGIVLFLGSILPVSTNFLPVSNAQSGNTLDKVLACGKPGEAGGIAPGTDLYRINLDLTKFPGAICNDGTGGIFYVRRYSNTDNRNKWVIYLQGGGDCGSGQACAQRWCSIETNFGANKMSSSFAPDKGIRGNGLLSPDSSLNNFATWNQVFVYYCSSDQWSGTAANVQLSATGVNGQSFQYTIHFKGAEIFDAVVSMLRRENKAKVKYRDQAGKKLVLPDLDDATTVVFAGASAGSGGVRNNTDRLQSLLRQNNTNCTGSQCPLQYFAVIDSGFPPDMSGLDFSQSVPCEKASLCSYEAFIQYQWNVVQRGTWGARPDQSCLDFHQKDGTEFECANLVHVMQNHLTSPYFTRQDTQDQLLLGNNVDAGLTTPQSFGDLVHAQLTNLVNLDSFAEEGSVRSGGAKLTTPGVFGAQCTDHETLTNNQDFFEVKVLHNGQMYSAHDVLTNWLRGQQPSVVIRPFTTPGVAPECPPEAK